MRVDPRPVLVLLSASLGLFAQEQPKPPPEVDQALRERVTQYMQFSVDRAFSKAYALVADESKDWYLSSGKGQFKKFKIEDIAYAPDFQKATVKMLVTQVFSMQGHEVVSEAPVTVLWVVVDGKWMYYHDPDVFSTPFGEVKMDRNAKSRTESVPTDVSDGAATRAAGKLTLEATTDKSEIVFVRGKGGSEEITVHNGFTGFVDIISDVVGDYRLFSVEPGRLEIASGKDVVLKVIYKPSDKIADDVAETFLRIRVEPFDRNLNVLLRLARAGSPGSPVPAQ